jgi:hypothetical protein
VNPFPYRVISAARIGRAGGHGRKLASRRKEGGRDGMQNRSAAYAEQLGRSGAGAPTAELGSFVGGDRNVAKEQT